MSDLWNVLWDYTQGWRASKDDCTGQDARNVCEDERILSIHGGPDPACVTCQGRLPERYCHACHVPLNRCEWLLSLARRWFTGQEREQATTASAGTPLPEPADDTSANASSQAPE